MLRISFRITAIFHICFGIYVCVCVSPTQYILRVNISGRMNPKVDSRVIDILSQNSFGGFKTNFASLMSRQNKLNRLKDFHERLCIDFCRFHTDEVVEPFFVLYYLTPCQYLYTVLSCQLIRCIYSIISIEYR